MIHYKKLNLFHAPRGNYLVHACNAQGVWGSGIAKRFRILYPKSYEYYHDHVKNRGVGNCLICPTEKYQTVVCLITSNDYGNKVDNPASIVSATESALKDFMFRRDKTKEIWSNKFNSGLFNVPWSKTQKLIKNLNVDWTVCYHRS